MQVVQYFSLFFCWALKDDTWEELCEKHIVQREGHLISSSKVSAPEACQFGFVLALYLQLLCIVLNFNGIQ